MQKTVKANAKINLFLNVLGKLPNGYHELETVMQSVSLYDTVTVKKAENGINVRFNLEKLNGGDNTVMSAARLFFNAAGVAGGAEIFVEKQIPLASGMGGGSADAAAVLTCLNGLYGSPLSAAELMSIALRVGADVPFCVSGGTALCGGIGEEITKINAMPQCFIVLAINDIKKSTAEAYLAIDRLENDARPASYNMQAAIENGSLGGICENLHNTFAEVVDNAKLCEITGIMKQCGAVGCNLSGAGPTVFGIFEKQEFAENCAERLKTSCRFVKVCTPRKEGIEQG